MKLDQTKPCHQTDSWSQREGAKKMHLAAHKDPNATKAQKDAARAAFARLTLKCLREAGLLGPSR